MATEPFPQSFRERLQWALREAALITGIFAFWIGIGLLFALALGVVAFVIRTFQIEQLRFVYDFTRRSSIVWTAVTSLAGATVGLYVFVRAGTILIDRYGSTVGE